MATITREIVHVRRLLADLSASLTPPILSDNQSVVKITTNTDIEIDCHFTRQHFISSSISLPYIRLEEQIADFFTKSHIIVRFGELGKLMLFDPP